MIIPRFISDFKKQIGTISFALMFCGCGGGGEEALEADTADESAGDLVVFFEKADPQINKLAKTASDAVEQGNYPLALQCINQLKAQGGKLTADQFMVVSTAGVNILGAITEAAESGDKKAQMMLNMQGAARRN